MMLVGIVLRIRDIDVAWLSRFLRFSADNKDNFNCVFFTNVNCVFLLEEKLKSNYQDLTHIA